MKRNNFLVRFQQSDCGKGMSAMGSLSTRRVIRRSAPAKITIVESKGCGGGDASEKENIVNCTSLYSLFETHYVKCNNSPAHHPQDSASGGTTDKMKSVLQPRKRLLNDRTVVPPPVAEHSRELTPPELTTSDTFKPAKRTLAQPNNNKPVEHKPGDEGFKQLPNVKIPKPITSESCDVLVSSPTGLTNVTTPESTPFRAAAASGRRDLTKKTPTHGRRLSIVRLSIAREGGALPSSKKDGNSMIKKNIPLTAESAGGNPEEPIGKEMVLSAQKRILLAEQSNRDAERARSRVLERRKSMGPKMTPVTKQGIGSYGGRSDALKKNVSEKVFPAEAQLTNSARKNAPDIMRTRRLAMALKSEQRLTEKNEQYGIQLRQLQAQIEERDHEVEKLRSAALLSNNLVNRQGEEIRELRFRLKETFNENAVVRHVCETLERDLRKTREALLNLERIQKVSTKPYEPNLVSLTSHLQSMTISMEPPMIRTCIEEGEEDSKSLEGSEGPEESPCSEQAELTDILAESDESSCSEESEATDILAESSPSVQELPQTQSDQDAQFTLQDLQEMVVHEENLLKKRCADALRELNLPLSPLLTPKGSLDVGSLKAMLVSISCKEEYLTPERITSIRKLSTWLGQS